jgi:hypothetical protein
MYYQKTSRILTFELWFLYLKNKKVVRTIVSERGGMNSPLYTTLMFYFFILLG